MTMESYEDKDERELRECREAFRVKMHATRARLQSTQASAMAWGLVFLGISVAFAIGGNFMAVPQALAALNLVRISISTRRVIDALNETVQKLAP